MKKKAVIYTRVSTDEQANGYSLDTQLSECRKYAAERGYRVLEEFKDDYTGTRLDRPGLDKLREFVARRQVDVAIVHDIDRLARRMIYQTLIEEELEKLGITVEYVLGQYADTDEGRLQKQIKGSIAEYERAKIIERSRRGKRGKAESGFVLVSGRPPYGYSVKKEPHKAWFEVAECEAEVVRLIYKWFLYGDGKSGPMSINGITTRLTEMRVTTRGDQSNLVAKKRASGVWSRETVYHILKNETYTGTWYYNQTRMVEPTAKDKKAIKDRANPKNASKKATDKYASRNKQVPRPREEWIAVPVPVLIDTRTFELAQKRLALRREQNKRNTVFPYVLRGRMKCAKCGYSIVGRNLRTRQYYHCSAAERSPGLKCDTPYYRCEHVDNAVWAWVRGILENPGRLADGLRAENREAERSNKALRERLALVEKNIGDTARQLEKLLDLYLQTDFSRDLLEERKMRLEKQAADLESERCEIAEYLAEQVWTEEKIRAVESAVAEVGEGLEAATVEDKWRYFELLDLRGALAHEDGQRVVYVKCRLGGERVQVENTSSPRSLSARTPAPRSPAPPPPAAQ